jgi:hypothetical protein
MAWIFVGYRREERSASGGRLHDRLREHFGRDNVFMEVNRIELGFDVIYFIDRPVDPCDVLFALI